MMNELLNRVTTTTGLSPDQAKAAVESVLGFLKEKLPAPLAGTLDSLLHRGASETEAGGQGMMGQAGSMLGNLFGNKG